MGLSNATNAAVKTYLRIPTPQPRDKRDSCNRQSVQRKHADAHASAHRCKGSTADARPGHTRKRLEQEPALCSVQVGECGDRSGDGSLQRHIPCPVSPDGSAAACLSAFEQETMRELPNDFDDFTAGNFRESRAQARSLKVGQARVRVGKEAAHLPILRFATEQE